MNEKQSRFVDEYLKDLNATQAATRAGYSAKTASSIGERLLRNVEVKEELQKRMNARAKRTEITLDYVLTTIKETIERCKQAEPVMIKGPDGEMIESGEYKFDATNVLKGSELLGRHLSAWKDRLDIGVTDALAERLARAKERDGQQ